MNSGVKYQEAGRWFRHLSALRRTTMGFLFATNGASVTIFYRYVERTFENALMFAVGNIMFCITILLQEKKLHRIQKCLAEYAKEQEGDSGPFIATESLHKGIKTTHVFVIFCIALIIFWVSLPIFIKIL